MPPLISWGSTSSVYPNCSRKNLIKVALLACLSWSSWNWAHNGYFLHLGLYHLGIISYPAVWKKKKTGQNWFNCFDMAKVSANVQKNYRHNGCYFKYKQVFNLHMSPTGNSKFILLLEWKSLITKRYLTQITPTKFMSITACHGAQQFQ